VVRFACFRLGSATASPAESAPIDARFIVTMTFDNGYPIAAMFPAPMPTAVMNKVLCARA
jgi:hypothetical protein